MSLIGISPMIWRRLLVRSDSTIADLHYTLQISMGWSDAHLNLFHIHGKDFGVYHDGGINFADNPEQVPLSTFGFRTRERFVYEYDFGDAWLHEVRVEKCLLLDPKRTYPVCIDGKQVAPPEDCGGMLAYRQRREELNYRSVFGDNESDEDFDDENNLEYERSEKQQSFDPNVFSRREVNARLRQYMSGDRDWLFSY
ncbi:MAG: plasmid pRiA4b ORF-3 family protein [Methylococcaceae bacterium]|nr:plasmid pRiA4b ORF-3 family protein [Methylococcaceae bacterium]